MHDQHTPHQNLLLASGTVLLWARHRGVSTSALRHTAFGHHGDIGPACDQRPPCHRNRESQFKNAVSLSLPFGP